MNLLALVFRGCCTGVFGLLLEPDGRIKGAECLEVLGSIVFVVVVMLVYGLEVGLSRVILVRGRLISDDINVLRGLLQGDMECLCEALGLTGKAKGLFVQTHRVGVVSER